MRKVGKRDAFGFQWWKCEMGRITRWVLYRNGYETGLFIDEETRGRDRFTLWKSGASKSGCALDIGWHRTVGAAKMQAVTMLTDNVRDRLSVSNPIAVDDSAGNTVVSVAR